jgi:hypothetical protein
LSFGQRKNALSPIEYRLFGIDIDLSDKHFAKATFMISLVPAGIVISSKALHSEKAPTPMTERFFGKEMLLRFEHSEKAAVPIMVTLSGMLTERSEQHCKNVDDAIPWIPSGIEIDSSEWHAMKIPSRKYLIFFGIFTVFSEERIAKAQLCRYSRLSGSVTDESEVQP